jgi:hypothetical protein
VEWRCDQLWGPLPPFAWWTSAPVRMAGRRNAMNLRSRKEHCPLGLDVQLKKKSRKKFPLLLGFSCLLFLWLHVSVNCLGSRKKSTVFWDITPCSSSKVNRRFGGNQRSLLPFFTLVSCSAYSLTLKMEETYSSETSVDFQLTTRRYIPEDSALHNHRCENLKSYILGNHSTTTVILLFKINWSYVLVK